MKKAFLILVSGVLVLWLAACSKHEAATPDTQKKRPPGFKFHGEGGNSPVKVITKTPVADMIKKQTLKAFPQKTIGEAFSAYSPAVSKEWRDDLGQDGSYYVDFICWFPAQAVTPEQKGAGVVQKGLDLKFVVHGDGDAYVTLAIKMYKKADGTVQTGFFGTNEINGVVADIYNNKELVF